MTSATYLAINNLCLICLCGASEHAAVGTDDCSVLFRKGRYDGQAFEECVVFYEESSNIEKARQIVEAGFICRSCVLTHDEDHPTDLDKLDRLLDVGVQYIATNSLGGVIEFEPYRHATEAKLRRDSDEIKRQSYAHNVSIQVV